MQNYKKLIVSIWPFAANIASSCPLLWTRYALGSAAAVLLFACAALLLYSLLRLVGEMQGGMIQLVGWTLVIRSGTGILADLFVLISTDVGMLLLRNPADAFRGCRLPRGFEVNRENPFYYAAGGMLFDKETQTLICASQKKQLIRNKKI